MKATVQIYRGIEFISVSDLPANQQLLLNHNSEPKRIKILMDGKVLRDCIQYSEYEKWYFTIYKKSVAPVVAQPVKEETFQMNISLHKA